MPLTSVSLCTYSCLVVLAVHRGSDGEPNSAVPAGQTQHPQAVSRSAVHVDVQDPVMDKQAEY